MRNFKNPKATRLKMSKSAKLRCTPEWRANRMKRATQLPKDKLESLYNSGLSQSALAKHFKVSQKVIYGFMRRNQMKTRPSHGISQPGALNGQWRGGINVTQKGYLKIKCVGHPRALKGYVMIHVLVMEQSLGRFLVWKGQGHPESEIVHHKNGNKKDNRIGNLSLTTYQKHLGLHAKMRRESE